MVKVLRSGDNYRGKTFTKFCLVSAKRKLKCCDNWQRYVEVPLLSDMDGADWIP